MRVKDKTYSLQLYVLADQAHLTHQETYLYRVPLAQRTPTSETHFIFLLRSGSHSVVEYFKGDKRHRTGLPEGAT
jgi:hypothetical protein